MKNLFAFFAFAIGILILSVLIYDKFFRPVPEPEVVIDYQYKTDTVYLDTFYIPGEPYPVETAPRIVLRYRIDSSALDSLKLMLEDQEIIIAGLKDSIAIHHNYLKQFPSNPKLLFMDLKRDSLQLGLLETSGQIEEKYWPIDLNRFSYRWNYASDLSRHPTKPPPVQEEPFAYYYAGGGVDFLYLSPYLSGSIEKEFTRIRLYSDIRVGLLNINASEIKVGVDYKFNGQINNRNGKRDN